MKLHPYIAAFLLAVWWLLRERWDTLPTFAASGTPWYVWAGFAWMLAVTVFLCGRQIAAGAVGAWGWVRSRMPSVDGPMQCIVFGIFCGVLFGFLLGFTLGGISWNPSPPSPPTPDVTPVVAPGLRVIFGRETGKPLNREQTLILGSTQITGYLNDKCVKIAGRPGWRKWDESDDKSADAPEMAKLWNATKGKLPPPFVVIANEKGTDVFPLPATEAATLDLLKKYGG